MQQHDSALQPDISAMKCVNCKYYKVYVDGYCTMFKGPVDVDDDACKCMETHQGGRI